MKQGDKACSSAGPQDENTAEHIIRYSSIELCNHMAQCTIASTESLIEALNDVETREERKALMEWVGAYIRWFDKLKSLSSIKRCTPLQEYSFLAGIQPVHDEHKGLLSDYFNGLCNAICEQYKHGEEPLIEALEYTLQTIDVGVFDGNPAPLGILGEKLLAKLDHARANFTKAAYPSYRSTLHALHLTLKLIKQIGPNQWDATQEDGLYNKFRVQVQGIVKKSKYYLIRYHAHLIEQSLQRLVSGGKSARFRDECRRVCQGLKGLHSLWKGAKSIATLEFDIEAFQSAYEGFRAAMTSNHIKAMSWYDFHQSMHHACLLSLVDRSQYDIFKEHLQHVHNMGRSLGTKCDLKNLRIGVLQQLRLLALEACDAGIRKDSMDELSSLAESCKTSDRLKWLEDKDVLEELLECLAAIAVHSQGDEKEAAEVALEILTDRPQNSSRLWLSKLRVERRYQAHVQKKIESWLDGQTLEEKLAAQPSPGAGASPNSLFCEINRKLQPARPKDDPDSMAAQEAHQALKENYQDPVFTMVHSLFRGQAPKHVDLLQGQLMVIEQIEVGKSPDDGCEAHQEDSVCVHRKRLEWVKTSIELEDIMKSRSTKPGQREREIQRVLLVGNPGTGKTTLSRKLAYNWAKGKWGREFQAVYVLPVRALHQSKYDSVSMRRDQTLATAIANNCFPLQNDNAEYVRLRNRVSEDLKQQTTLVILDGLDERHGASELLLNQAKAGMHKLLMLSRPYNIEGERPVVDVEMEHVGLNDWQMEAFIKSELDHGKDQESSAARELLKFIRSQPAIQAVAHVPVNLQMLCAMWQDDEEDMHPGSMQGSLPGLYRRLTMYVWERYKKEKAQNLQHQDREALFTTLGKIAIKGLEKGKLLFSQGIVGAALDEADGCVRAMVDDSGFLLLQNLGKEYQFPHLTFQEYFAGRMLARQLLSGHDREQARAEKFVSSHKYDARFRVVLSFMAGEVVYMQGFEGIKQILMLVEQHPREVVGVQHVLLQTQLLHEWLSVDGEDTEEELFELEQMLNVIQTLKMWFDRGLRHASQGNIKLLSLLTAGVQRSQSITAHATPLQAYLIKFCNDSDWRIRRVAFKTCMKVIAMVPRQAPALQEVVLAACNDPDGDLRVTAIGGACKMVKIALGNVQALQKALLSACEDMSWKARQAAIKGLCEMVEVMPGQAPALQKTLLSAIKDSNWGVRRAAIEGICKMAKVLPRQIPALQEVLLNLCKDSDMEIRDTAMMGICKMVEVAPGQVMPLQQTFLNLCKDSDMGIRQTVALGIRNIIEVVSGQVQAFQELLLTLCNDLNGGIRETAIMGIRKSIEIAPGCTPALEEALLVACEDVDQNIREAAISGICQLAESAPGEAPVLRKALLNLCESSRLGIRDSAVMGIRKMVEVAPEQVPALQGSLLALCKHADVKIRETAMMGIRRIIEVEPRQVPALQEELLIACEDSDQDTRKAAIKSVCRMAEVAPGHATALQVGLLNLCKNSHKGIRKTAVVGIPKMIEVAPGDAPALKEALIIASQDADENVREAAIVGVCKMIQAAPGHVSELHGALLTLCKDVHRKIRAAALRSMCEMMEGGAVQGSAFEEELLSSCKDSYWKTRQAAINGVCIMLEGGTGQALPLQDAILNACEDEDAGIRETAIRGVCNMIELAPEQAPLVQNALLNACKDSIPTIQETAIRGLCKMIAVAPELTPHLQEALPTLCKDRNRAIRQNIVNGIVEMVGVVPILASALQEALLIACQDSKKDIRKTAVRGVCKMIEVAPAQTPALQKVLLIACEDKDDDICKAAIHGIRKMIEVAPEYVPTFQEAIVIACEDAYCDIREAAVLCVCKMMEVAPQQGPALQKALLILCKDTARGIRQTAIGGLQKMVGIVPGQAPALQETLLSACKDSSRDFRQTASDIFCNMISLAPEQASAMWQALLLACKGSAREIREAAISGLCKMVKIAPGQATHAVREEIIKSCYDTRECVRLDAQMALKWFPLEQLLEDYWTTQCEALILPIAARLYFTPLVRSNPKKSCHRLVLYPSASSPKRWVKPEKTVSDFVKRVQRADPWMMV